MLLPGAYDPIGRLDGDIDYMAGDIVQVFNRTSGSIVVEGTVLSVTGPQQPHDEGTQSLPVSATAIRLDRSVGSLPLVGTHAGDIQVFN